MVGWTIRLYIKGTTGYHNWFLIRCVLYIIKNRRSTRSVSSILPFRHQRSVYFRVHLPRTDQFEDPSSLTCGRAIMTKNKAAQNGSILGSGRNCNVHHRGEIFLTSIEPRHWHLPCPLGQQGPYTNSYLSIEHRTSHPTPLPRAPVPKSLSNIIFLRWRSNVIVLVCVRIYPCSFSWRSILSLSGAMRPYHRRASRTSERCLGEPSTVASSHWEGFSLLFDRFRS